MPFLESVRVAFAGAAVTAAVTALAASPASAETKSYAVSWFAQAMYSQDGDCPDGVNLPWKEHRIEILKDYGYTDAQIEAMVEDELSNGSRAIQNFIAMRGRIDGQPTNPYTFPSTVIDPQLHFVKGAKYGYGFNLDGKQGPAGFEDPDTHETGVDNELARALGCMREFRGSKITAPLYWDWTWGQLSGNQPAWVITLSGEDLSKDGEVTVTFDRALEHLRHNIDGTPRTYSTYRIDPDPRSHNVYAGTLKDGRITLRDPGTQDISLMQDPLVAMVFRMTKVRMRLDMKKDDALEVMVGGYQPWSDLYFSFAGGGAANESASTGDMPGIYYLFRRHADADPDPKTGQNASISATYYMRAIPAFAVEPRAKEGQVAVR